MRIMCMIFILLRRNRMDWNAFRRPRRKAALVIVAAVSLMATAACGSSDDSASASGGIPSTVKVVGIEPLTGPAAFAGLAAQKGYELAIKQINEQGFLGSGKK